MKVGVKRRLAFVLSIWASSLAAQESFETEFRRGLVALAGNNLAAARRDLEDAALQQPANGLVWAALAQTYRRAGEADLANKAAARADASADANPAVEHALALYYAEAGDFSRAAGAERRFAASRAADHQAATRAAELSLRAGDATQAMQWAKTALQHDDTAALHYILSQAYAAANQTLDGLRELRNAVERDPGNETYVAELGEKELRRGDFTAALATLGNGRRHFPNSAQIALSYGVAAYGERRFSDAIDAFLTVIRIDPSVEQPYVFLSRLLDQAGERLPQITAAYAAWERTAPANCLPACLHAKALSAAGANPAAIEADLRRSIALNSGYWESHFELGVLLAKSGRWEEAAAELARGIELNPKHAAAHFQLARVYEKLGKTDLAKAERAKHQQLTAAETDLERALPGARNQPIP